MQSCTWHVAIAAAALGLAGAARASIVVDWNDIALEQVRSSRLGPPIIARALAITHTCMYEAWVAYDARAIGTVLGSSLRRPAAERTDANKSVAVSQAAYRCLLNLFPNNGPRLRDALQSRGMNPDNLSLDTSTAQGVGNVAAQAVINARRHDGSNQYGDLAPVPYGDYTGYAPRNPPLPFCTPQTVGPCPSNGLGLPSIVDPYHWQPLVNDLGAKQAFITPFWEMVKPFALKSADQFDNQPGLAPPPNYLNGSAAYAADVQSMLDYSAALDLPRKVIVEYWADGPASELPPGHWGLFAQAVSLRDNNSIDDDVQMFFAMHNASFDAGIVAWHLKRKYDGVRPITAVRYLKQGQQVFAWGGPPAEPSKWIAGEKWLPYNPGSNITPSFPGYISGHSTFSSASAAVLRAFTGSDDFGFTTIIPPGFGRVEPNIPPVPTILSYPTFTAASDEAGLSRLYGGIHFSDDNVVGQRLGTLVGQQAWAKAKFLFEGGLATDGAASVSATKSSTLSWTHTVSGRSNRLLLLAVTYRDGNQPLVSVSYAGRPLTRLAAQNAPGNQNRVEVWYLLAPPAGSDTVVVNLTNARTVVAGAQTFIGVDQTTPFGIVRAASDGVRNACVTLANAPAPLVFNVLGANGDADSAAPGTGQATAWNTATGSAGGDIRGLATTVAGAPVATICETLGENKPWALLAVPLNPAFSP